MTVHKRARRLKELCQSVILVQLVNQLRKLAAARRQLIEKVNSTFLNVFHVSAPHVNRWRRSVDLVKATPLGVQSIPSLRGVDCCARKRPSWRTQPRKMQNFFADASASLFRCSKCSWLSTNDMNEQNSTEERRMPLGEKGSRAAWKFLVFFGCLGGGAVSTASPSCLEYLHNQ